MEYSGPRKVQTRGSLGEVGTPQTTLEWRNVSVQVKSMTLMSTYPRPLRASREESSLKIHLCHRH